MKEWKEQLEASRFSFRTAQTGRVQVPDQLKDLFSSRKTAQLTRTLPGLQVKSLSQMFRPWGFHVWNFLKNTRFLVALVRLYGSLFVQMLVDQPVLFGANNKKKKKLCSPQSVWDFHGSVSWLHGWDGWSGAAHFTHWRLFICLCAPQSARSQCCVLWNRSTVLEHNGALLTGGIPGAVVGKWVQPRASFSAHLGSMLVYCCSGDTDLYVNSLGKSPHYPV